MTTTEGDKDRYIVPGLERGLKILQVFSQDKSELGIAELARAIGISRSTAFRLVHTLEIMGFLKKVDNSKKYQLGSRILDLGFSYLSGVDIVDIARPFLQILRDQIDASVHLVVRDAREVIYVARFAAKKHFTSNVGVGTRFPAHATTSGRVILSDLTMTEIVGLFEGVEFKVFTEYTPSSLGDLINMLETGREKGYELSWGYFEPGVASLAVPIYNNAGRVSAAIGVSCPVSAVSQQDLEGRILEATLKQARAISESMGYKG